MPAHATLRAVPEDRQQPPQRDIDQVAEIRPARTLRAVGRPAGRPARGARAGDRAPPPPLAAPALSPAETTVVRAASPAARSAVPVLAAADLTCQRGDRALFEHLDLALEPGTVTWLRGRNGRGKTSLLRLLASLATPMAGTIHVGGAPVLGSGAGWRAGLVYIGHQNGLKDDLTASEALAFLCRLGGRRPTPAEIDAALARLGVQAKRRAPVRTLSQGQRRRVALARLALALDAPLWLLDEPFDALDTDGIDALNALLAEHARRGGASLLTSHQALSLAEPVPRILQLDHHGHA